MYRNSHNINLFLSGRVKSPRPTTNVRHVVPVWLQKAIFYSTWKFRHLVLENKAVREFADVSWQLARSSCIKLARPINKGLTLKSSLRTCLLNIYFPWKVCVSFRRYNNVTWSNKIQLFCWNVRLFLHTATCTIFLYFAWLLVSNI